MIPWEFLAEANVPGGETLRLSKRGDEYSIRVEGYELMNSRAHGSEEVLAREGIKRLKGDTPKKILIGGLGMGYTLRAALDAASDEDTITVAELVPELVEWNKTHYGHLAGHPLNDPRVKVFVGDVGDAIAGGPWDAILLDVDNGPDGLTCSENTRLYSRQGLLKAKSNLKQGGILGVWSSMDDPAFTSRLKKCNMKVDIVHIKARIKRGSRHTLWFAGSQML